ncbi:MAG: DUF692 domain-containing protein [Gammaproteobacteria bacterium]|nr:DUF692 domain-containing protein [Gammaproteobacteria bacterium]
MSTVRRIIRDYGPSQISDHLCFTHHAGHHFNELLPIPYTAESLQHVSRTSQYIALNMLNVNFNTPA